MPEVVIGNFGSTDFPMAADGIAAGQNVSSPAAPWTPPPPPPPQAYYPPPPVHEYYPPPSPPPVYYPPPSWEHPPTAPLKEQPPSTYEYRPPQSPGYYEPPMRVYSPPVHHAQAPNPPAEFRQLEDLSQELLSSSQFMSLWGAPSFLPTVSYPQNHYQADTTPNHVFLSGTGSVQDRPDSVGVFGGVHPDYWDRLWKDAEAAEEARLAAENRLKAEEGPHKAKAVEDGECWEVKGKDPYGPYTCAKKKCEEVKMAAPWATPAAGSVVVNGIPIANEAQARQWREVCENRAKEFQELAGPAGLGNNRLREKEGRIKLPKFKQEAFDTESAWKEYAACVERNEARMKEYEARKQNDLEPEIKAREEAHRVAKELYDSTVAAADRELAASLLGCLWVSKGIPKIMAACSAAATARNKHARWVAAQQYQIAADSAWRSFHAAEDRWRAQNPLPRLEKCKKPA